MAVKDSALLCVWYKAWAHTHRDGVETSSIPSWKRHCLRHNLNLQTAAKLQAYSIQEALRWWNDTPAPWHRSNPLGFVHTRPNNITLHSVSKKELWALLAAWSASQRCSAIRSPLFGVLFCHSSGQLYHPALGYMTLTWHVGTFGAMSCLSSYLTSLRAVCQLSDSTKSCAGAQDKQPART